jgi:uncharacterized repeat protein (TIGR01451 family)
MKIARSFLPIFIGLAITCSMLFLLAPQITHADPASLTQTTVEDFNLGSFYRTGMTRDSDGEVTLLRSGIAGEWITNINATGLVPRYGHAAIVHNNHLYVFGGQTGASSLRSIQYAQINTQTHNLSNWITSSVSLSTGIYTFTSGSAKTGVAYLSAVPLHNRVYLLGGENGDQTHRYSAVAFATLDPTTGELGALTATAPLPKPLSEGQAVVVNNRIYYLGGRMGASNRGTNTIYYAEPLTATGVITAWFTTTLPLPYPPYGHMAIGTDEGRLYAMAGVSDTTFSGGVVPAVYYANPVTSTGNITQWQETLNLPVNNFAGSAAYFGGQIYAIGGAENDLSNPSDKVYTAFDEPTGGVITWTATSAITPARTAATTLINSDGWIYVVGGSAGSLEPIQSSIINAGATTGNAGLAYAGRGTFRSAEFDLVKNYQVTNLSWRAFLSDPSEVTLTVRYRYRQSFGPYSNWSDYMPSEGVPGIATTDVPLALTARYVQYEAFFSTTNALTTPILYEMNLAYDIPRPPQFVKSASPASGSSVKAGDRITYTIRFTNTTELTNSQVIVRDIVPDNTTYVPGSIFASPGITISVFPPNLIWEVGDLHPGDSGQIGFAVTVNNGLAEGTRIGNVASFDSNVIFLRSNGVTHIAGIPPRLFKTHVLSTLWGSVQPNDLITYTLTYSNPPESPMLTNVIISDTLPPEVSFVSGTPAPNVATIGNAVVLSWTIPSVPILSAGSVNYTVQVKPPAQAPNGALIKNTAHMSAASRPSVSSETDEVDVLYRYDLQMKLSVDKAKAPAGSSLIYTYRLTNTTQMPITLTGVTVYAYLKPGLPEMTRTHVLACVAPCSGWDDLGLDPVGNQTYSALVPPLGPNQSTSISLVAQISPTLPLDVLAVSNYSDAGNEQGGEGIDVDGFNQFDERTTIVNGPDIAVQRILAPGRGIVKQNLNVAIVVANNGFAPAKGPDNKGWFGVDLYVKPYGAPPPAGPSDRELGACPTASNPCPFDQLRYPTQYQAFGYDPAGSLAADQVITMTFPLTIAPSSPLPGAGPVRYWLYAQADTYWNDDPSIYGTAVHGRVSEGNEANNIFGPIEIVIDYAKVYLPLVRR